MMRSALLRFNLLFFLVCAKICVLAQGDVVQTRLDSLQKADNFSEWIYQRLDFVFPKPQERLSYLLDSQRKLWRKAKTADEHFAMLTLLNTQGYDLLLDGNILGSINSYEQAYAYYLKNKVSTFDIVEYVTKPLCNNYTRLGDYERALYLQQKSIDFLIKNNDDPAHIAAIYSNMAVSYRSLGNYKVAEQCINSGLKLVNVNAPITIILNNIFVDILFDQKAYAKALKLIEVTIAKQKNITVNNAYWLMGSYTSAGNISLALKNPAKADSYFNKALIVLNSYYKGTRLREKATLFTQLGKVKILQHQPEMALKYFDQTLVTLKITDQKHHLVKAKIYGENKLVEVFEQMANAYSLLKKPEQSLQYIQLSLFAADQIRNEFTDDQTKERLQGDLKLIAEKGIAICYELYQQKKDKKLLHYILELAEQSKARTLLDQIKRNQQLVSTSNKDSLFSKKQAIERAIIYNEKQVLEAKGVNLDKIIAGLKFDLALINKQIKQKYKQFNFDTYSIQIDKVLSALPKGKIIEYFVGQNDIYAIEISAQQLDRIIKIPDAKAVKAAIQLYAETYFQHGPDAMLNNPEKFFQSSHQIYQSVLKGINLEKPEPLTVIPDGVLGYLSFDGLITQPSYSANISSWPYLIKNHIITYAFSLNTLTTTKTQENSKGFAGLFITHQKGNHQPLKAVEDEAEKIKKLINGQFLFNEDVNSTSFNTAFEENKILHIGTHAYLSGKNLEPTLDFENEKIFLFELAAKKSAPSLVVLSACRTADGLLANGEGIISLSRGFNAIGTKATIAGLWNVNDVAASVITSSFYRNLLQKKSNGTALHQAKLDWLNAPQAAEAFYLPYYWDSLIYMGVDQQLTLQPATNKWILIGIGIVLLLATFLFLWNVKKGR